MYIRLLEPLIGWLFWVEYIRSTHSVTSCDYFLLHGACDPFLPRPIGIPSTATSEKFGFFLDFVKHATNSRSYCFISPTATLCEHIPKDLKFTQSLPHLNWLPLHGKTRCGCWPLRLMTILIRRWPRRLLQGCWCWHTCCSAIPSTFLVEGPWA